MLILTYISHFLSDYVFQTKKIATDKADGVKNAYIIHFIHHFFTMIILFNIVYFLNELNPSINNQTITFEALNITSSYWLTYLLIFIISILHILINLFKYWSNKNKKRAYWYFIDQALHIITIYLFVRFFELYFFGINNVFSYNYLIILKYGLAVLLLTVVSGDFVEKFVSMLKVKNYKDEPKEQGERNEDRNSISKAIGMVERVIMVLGILIGMESIVIAVLGFKTLITFSNSRKLSAEYFILGNLASITMVILIYVFLFI